MAENTAKKPSIFSRIGKFFRDQKGEMKKIVWPPKKQVINNTGIVLVAIALFAVVVCGFDWVLGTVVTAIIGA